MGSVAVAQSRAAPKPYLPELYTCALLVMRQKFERIDQKNCQSEKK